MTADDFEEEIKAEKLKVILSSKAFADPLHPKHGLAMAEFRKLHGLELPSDAKLLDSQDDNFEMDELTKDPAFVDRMNPRHKEVMDRFNEIHGIE